MTPKLRIIKDKTDVSGYAPIFLFARLSGRRLVMYTGIKVRSKDWDTKKEIVKNSATSPKSLNLALHAFKERVISVYTKFYIEDISPTPEMIKDELKKKKTPEKDLIILYEEFLEDMKKKRSLNTLKNYRTLYNHLKRNFKRKVYPSGYTIQKHNNFIDSLTLSQNGIFSINKDFKSFLTWCHDRHISFHDDTKKIKAVYVQPDIISLTFEEIKAIEKAELKNIEVEEFTYTRRGKEKTSIPKVNLERFRDCYLFQCFTGMAYVDAEKISPENLVERNGQLIIRFLRTKTRAKIKRHTEVVVTDKAKAILEKYSGIYHGRLLNYPSNVKMNQYIKIIGKKAGINTLVQKTEGNEIVNYKKYELLTTHVARHTYATLSFELGVPPDIIARNMGSTRKNVTDTYMKVNPTFQHTETAKYWKNS